MIYHDRKTAPGLLAGGGFSGKQIPYFTFSCLFPETCCLDIN